MVRAVDEKKLVIDSKRNVWLFYTMSDGKIGYIVKKNRGQPITGQLEAIGSIEEFDIIVDDRDNIHIVALSSEQKVVYLRHDTKDWLIHNLYGFSGKSINISALKIIKDGAHLHLLYVYSADGGSSALFHHQWTGNEWKGHRVFDMPGRAVSMCFDANVDRKNQLCIAATAGKTFYLWEFDGSRWMQAVRKDGGVWEHTQSITFQEDYILIQNGRGVFFAKKVWEIDKAQPEEIIQGKHVEKGPVIINRKNTLYVAWTEGGSLGYRTSYDGGASWGRVKYYHHVRGETLEVYGFSNTYSLLISAKRVIATSPPELHIPFLHRSVERIRLPEDVFREEDKRLQSCSQDSLRITDTPEGSGEYGQSTSVPETGPDYRYRSDEPQSSRDQSSVSSTGSEEISDSAGEGKPGSGQYNESSPGSAVGIPAEIEKVRSEFTTLEQRIQASVSERLEKLESEVARLKEKLNSTGAKNRIPEPPGGNVISQDMINKYLRKR